MEEFRIIYRILKRLHESMDYEEFNNDTISHETLGITKEKWNQLMVMLVKNGYVEGVSIVPILGSEVQAKLNRPRITLQGLEYLEENSLMKKAANMAKGIIDTIL